MTIHLISTLSKTKWPELWHKCYKIFENLPYQLKLWDKKDIDNLLKKDDNEFFNTLESLPEIYKIDYVRYIILEKFKGAYFDLDVEIVNDFLNVIDSNIIYIAEGWWNCALSNHIMISPKTEYSTFVFNSMKHKFKQNILFNLDKCKKDIGYTLETVGAMALTNYVAKWGVNLQLLGYPHFTQINSAFSFAKHHSTKMWAPIKIIP